MHVGKFSFSDRFARYLVTLVVGNNVIGLFLALSKYQEGGPDFLSLLIFVLAIAHICSLMCLFAIDITEFLAEKFFPPKSRYATVRIIVTVGVTLGPALWLGYRFGIFIAQQFNLGVTASFADIVRPGTLFGVLATTLALGFMAWLKSLKAHYAQQASLMAAERRVLQARFDLLAKELHPHLLFNMIQNVLSLMKHDHAAKKMLEELAVYYQEILLVIDKTAISLAQEIALCRHYMALQQSRFKNLSFAVNDKTNGHYGDLLMPPLLLQPLIENAVKYAMAQDNNDKAIGLEIKSSEHILQIIISNPLSSAKNAVVPGFSKGLKNTEQRMKEFFGDGARITMVHEANITNVTLDLPHATQTTN